MTEHRCQYIYLMTDGNECGKPARCTVRDVWFCAEHYDLIVEAVRELAELFAEWSHV